MPQVSEFSWFNFIVFFYFNIFLFFIVIHYFFLSKKNFFMKIFLIQFSLMI